MSEKFRKQLKSHPLIWMIVGVFICLLITASNVSVSWERINPANKQKITWIAYSCSVFISYLLWLGIIFFIKRIAENHPMFSQSHRHWLTYHGFISIIIALLHLLLDTLLLWWVFSFEFDFFSAYIQKIMTWLPFELLAYWACLGIFSLINTHAKTKTNYMNYFSIKYADETKVIAVHKISFLKACDNYVELWEGEQCHLIHDSMKGLEKRLNPEMFLRIHRSYILNLHYLSSIQNKSTGHTYATLNDGTELPISRRKKPQLNQLIKHRPNLS